MEFVFSIILVIMTMMMMMLMMVLMKSLTNESILSLFSGQDRKNPTCHKQDLYQRKTYVYSLLNEVRQQ